MVDQNKNEEQNTVRIRIENEFHDRIFDIILSSQSAVIEAKTKQGRKRISVQKMLDQIPPDERKKFII